MTIELYHVEKGSVSGSKLHKMIQNRHTPLVDLLVRESIQNSLDAADPSSPSRFVTVEFNTGSFNRDALDSELEGVSLGERPQWGNSFLSISDKNTVGLTGSYRDKKSRLYGLVYGIMEGQQAAGAGGAWGIGKTVYFRLGVGLVLYYSRVRTRSGYDSLLTAALVEDENLDTALLPAFDGSKYGMAWWGDETAPGSGKVRECRREETIDRVLGIFGMRPYEGTTTGTVIIIPFIDEQFLLTHNLPQRVPGTPAPYWLDNLESYIRLSVQKWYAARLNNRRYPHGKYLNLKVNGKAFSPGDMEPFFRLAQALYNKAALSNTRSPDAETVGYSDCDIHCVSLAVKSLIKPNLAGHLAYALVNRRQLGMTAPDYRPSPYEYVTSQNDEKNYGKPILMFSRKPGMTVNFEPLLPPLGDWLQKVPTTSEDEYLVAYFVLNSEPLLQNVTPPLSLEEYIRKSEKADHFSWEDHDQDMSGFKPPIISRIKDNASRKLSEAFEVTSEDVEKTADTALGNLLGRVFLPPEGFGRRPAPGPAGAGGGGGNGGGGTASRRNIRYTYSISGYTSEGMILSIRANTGKRAVRSFGVSLETDTVTGPVSFPDWEDKFGLTAPFVIRSVELSPKKLDGDSVKAVYPLAEDGTTPVESLVYTPLLSKSGDWYGISIGFRDGNEHSVDTELRISVTIRRKDMKPSLLFEF